MEYDLRDVIEKVAATVAEHHLGQPGHYRRQRTGDLDLYGCTAAATILYTIGRLPTAPAERAQWIALLQSFQNADDGLFHHPAQHPFHTTATCVATLDLFDARPRHPLRGLSHLAEKDALLAYLDQLDWRTDPVAAGQQGAGVYAARILAGEGTADWEDAYFDWLWEQTDWPTGLWRKGQVGPMGDRGLFPHLAGSFYHLSNVEYARRQPQHPLALLDCCLQIREESIWPTLAKQVGPMELQWGFCVARALRHGGDKFRTGRHALAKLLHDLYWFLRRLEPAASDEWNDLERLAGTVSCFAELQQASPGNLRTERPLRLVLDRRPFI